MIYILSYNKIVEYEELYKICFDCGQYGHRAEFCPSKAPSTNTVDATGNLQGEQSRRNKGNEIDVENPYGPWMLMTLGRRWNAAAENKKFDRIYEKGKALRIQEFVAQPEELIQGTRAVGWAGS